MTLAVSERMLRYDPDGEFDFHDDFGWLDITHGVTYANAARWHLVATAVDAPTTSGSCCGRCSSPTGPVATSGTPASATRAEVEPRSTTSPPTARSLQHESLLDGTTAFIVHAHAVKMSVAATEEAVRLGSRRPARRDRPFHGRAQARAFRRRDRHPFDRLPQRPRPTRLTLEVPAVSTHTVDVRLARLPSSRRPGCGRACAVASLSATTAAST